MLLLALLACLPTPRLETTNVSVLLETLLTQPETACLAPTDVRTAHQPLFATAVSLLFSSKATLAKSPATMASLLSAQFVWAAQLAASSAQITSSATTALTTSTCTRATATEFALLVRLATAALATGSADLAMNLVRLALTILLTAPAASTEWAIFRPQLNLNLVSFHVSTAPLLAKESARSVTSDAQLALDQLLTVSHALLVKSCIREDAGAHALLFRCKQWVKMLPVSINVLMDSTSCQ